VPLFSFQSVEDAFGCGSVVENKRVVDTQIPVVLHPGKIMRYEEQTKRRPEHLENRVIETLTSCMLSRRSTN
jgi:hypothetical protein